MQHVPLIHIIYEYTIPNIDCTFFLLKDLCAQQIAITLYIQTSLHSPGLECISVHLNMSKNNGVKKLVWLYCCPSTTSTSCVSSVKHHWSSYIHYLAQWAKFSIKEEMISPSTFIKNITTINNVLQILLNETIHKFLLEEVSMYICLPQSLTDVKKFTIALAHRRSE